MAARNSSRWARRSGRTGGNRPRTHPPRHQGRSPRARRKPALNIPDLNSLLGRFCDALALMAVACRSLEARELHATAQEALVLRAGLVRLDAVYNELDAADQQLRKAAR